MLRFLLTTVETGCAASRLALRYLYGVVADAPLDTRVRYFSPDEKDDVIYEEIVRGGYNIVYFHCDMDNESKICHLCEIVKKAVPSSIVIVGGMQVTFGTRDFMLAHPEVDYVIRGEGEKVLYDFLKSVITYKFDFENIPGLAYWDNDEVFVNKLGDTVKFDDIPFPYEYEGVEAGDTAYYESARGCPDRCFYSQYTSKDRMSYLPLARVSTELRYFLAKEAGQVVFLDKWFNYSSERAFRIWQYIMDNDNGKTSFRFDVNGDLLDEATIELLSGARKGLFEFDIDIESTNPEALAMSGRKENIYQLLSNTEKLIRDTEVTVNVYQKIGLPYENTDLFARAFNKIYALHADSMNVEVLRINKGTRMRLEADKYGYLYSSKPPYEVIANDFLRAAEVIRIKMAVETAGLYMNGGYTGTINRIGLDTGLKPFQFYMKLGEYIYKKGLSFRTDTKENLYRILHDFAFALYDEMSLTLKLQVLSEIIKSDLESGMTEDQARKFEIKGWEMDV